MARVQYTGFLLGRWLIIALFAALCGVGVYAVILSFAGIVPGPKPGRPPLFFVAIWLAVLAWNGYVWLYRLAWQLELDGEVVRWRTPFRRGEVSVAQLRSIGPFALSQQISALTFESAPKIYVLTLAGITPFAQELLRVAPDARYEENDYATRLAKRSRQWASGFRRIS